MINEEEFLNIIKNDLTLTTDGKVTIKDPKKVKQYEEYIKSVATSDTTKSTNLLCGNVLC